MKCCEECATFVPEGPEATGLYCGNVKCACHADLLDTRRVMGDVVYDSLIRVLDNVEYGSEVTDEEIGRVRAWAGLFVK